MFQTEMTFISRSLEVNGIGTTR